MFKQDNFQVEMVHVSGYQKALIVRDEEGFFVTEFIGSNGGDDSEPADLWAEFEEWRDSLQEDPDKILHSVAATPPTWDKKARYEPVQDDGGYMTYEQALSECQRLNTL